MRRSQVAQAHSTTYHPQTNGLVERQIVGVDAEGICSRYMTDWDRYFPQVIGAYNSTQHSITGVSPHMMLSGHEKSLTLNFFYSEYEGKKTSPQVYVRNVIRRQQELNDLCRRNTQQEQASRGKIKQESSWCKSLLGRSFLKTPKYPARNKKTPLLGHPKDKNFGIYFRAVVKFDPFRTFLPLNKYGYIWLRFSRIFLSKS